MAYVSARDLKQDILFRASESVGGVSGWDTKAMDFLNRVYTSLANGSSEFLPEYVDDWWWMRGSGVLTLLPPFSAGSVSVVNSSISATLSTPPAYSIAGYRIRIEGHPDIFTVATHTAGLGPITLDTAYTGPTDTLAAFTAMKLTYALDVAVAGLISPMTGFRGRQQILGTTPERMDNLFRVNELRAGPPTFFSMEGDQTVKFSHGGLTDGTSMRVEYRYRPAVADLTDSDTSIPLVPLQYRHILSDMALSYVMTDKNDDRAAASAGIAKAGLIAMYRENRRRLKKISTEIATIRPRGNAMSLNNEPLRTESGLIIG